MDWQDLFACKLRFFAVIWGFIVPIGIAAAQSADPPFELPAPDQLALIRSAELVTSKGNLYFELYPEDAPWHVANFKYLADKGFYKNLSFHEFYPNYMIRAGKPGKHPESGPGYSLPPEFSSRTHQFGTLSMVRRQDWVNPTRVSHGSQFQIILVDSKHLDGKYTVFGQLIGGESVLQNLTKGDRILDLKVFVRK